jgi:hypothetical protein
MDSRRLLTGGGKRGDVSVGPAHQDERVRVGIAAAVAARVADRLGIAHDPDDAQFELEQVGGGVRDDQVMLERPLVRVAQKGDHVLGGSAVDREVAVARVPLSSHVVRDRVP